MKINKKLEGKKKYDNQAENRHQVKKQIILRNKSNNRNAYTIKI